MGCVPFSTNADYDLADEDFDGAPFAAPKTKTSFDQALPRNEDGPSLSSQAPRVS